MASGKTHALCSIALTVPTTIVLGPFAGIGCIAGVLLTPDLDHHASTGLEKVPIVGWLWQALWTPYERWLPHRELLSHLPVVGTFIRCAYLLCCLVAIWGTAYAVQTTYTDSIWVTRPYLIYINPDILTMFFIGLTISDIAHFIFDLPKGAT